MRSLSVALLAVLVLSLPLATAAPAVVLEDHGEIEAPGAITAIDVRPGGAAVLLVGEDGFAHRIDGAQPTRRDLDVQLGSGRTADFHDVDWHPGGATALLVGASGMLMRYEADTHAITAVDGSALLAGRNLIGVEWRPGADVAYIAAEDGALWRYAAGSGPVLIDDGLSTTDITSLTCHRSANICVVTTSDDGIALIGREHEVVWLSGTSTTTWVAAVCSDATLNECTAFGMGLTTVVIRLNTETTSESSVGKVRPLVPMPSEMTGASVAAGGSALVHLSPMGLLRHDPISDEVYDHLNAEQLVAFDPVVAGRAIAGVWEDSVGTGWLLTADGDLIGMTPDMTEAQAGLFETLGGIVVAIAVIGTIVGLAFMNSPKLQAWYLRGRRRRQS
jgi:hypothetical protein